MKNKKQLQSVILILILILALTFTVGCDNAHGESSKNGLPQNEEEMLQKWNDVVVEKNTDIDNMRIMNFLKKMLDSSLDSVWDQTFTEKDKIADIIDALNYSNVSFKKESISENDKYRIEDGWIYRSDGIWINFSDEKNNSIMRLTVDRDGYIHIFMPESTGYVFVSTNPISYSDFEESYISSCIRK